MCVSPLKISLGRPGGRPFAKRGDRKRVSKGEGKADFFFFFFFFFFF